MSERENIRGLLIPLIGAAMGAALSVLLFHDYPPARFGRMLRGFAVSGALIAFLIGKKLLK